jgi:hypothetical protein
MPIALEASFRAFANDSVIAHKVVSQRLLTAKTVVATLLRRPASKAEDCARDGAAASTRGT